jgi:hypothetical protein
MPPPEISKYLISNKLRYARNKTQSENIISKISNISDKIIINMMKEKENK